MKKHILSLILALVHMHGFSQISFIGFDRTTCIQAMNSTYTYQNFTSGGGSGTMYGFSVYQNGNAIYTASGNMGNGKTCKALTFINDSIGFLVYYSGNTSHRVLRTEDSGQTWDDIGGGAPNFFGFYVVNSTTAYLVTQWNFPLQLYIARCSAVPSNADSNFIYDQNINADVFATDTLMTNDLCEEDSLSVFVWNGVDTITYHINFNLEFIGAEESQDSNQLNYSVYPNPTNNYFKLSTLPTDIRSVQLFSLNGTVVEEYDSESIDNNNFSLHQIPDGTYVIRMEDKNNAVSFLRLVVNN